MPTVAYGVGSCRALVHEGLLSRQKVTQRERYFYLSVSRCTVGGLPVVML